MLVYILMITFFTYTNCWVKDEPPTDECVTLLENLANALANFTLCSVMNSRPIKLCESCVYSYIDIIESYQNISLSSDKDGKCIDGFVNLDRLQILRTQYQNSYNLWNQAKCYECFKSVDGKLTANVSEDIVQFNKLFDNFKGCLNNSNVNSSNLCEICFDSYSELDKFYRSISNENDQIGVCMDIVDLMNGTRGYWSETCCKYRRQNEVIFLTTSVMMIFTAVLFYIFGKYFTDKKMPTIFKQSRFAQVLNNSSSINSR